MLRKTRTLFLVCSVVLITAFVGCPTSAPKLSVSPTTLNFGTTLTQKSFAVSNSGGGTLAWRVESKPDWLTVSIEEGNTASQSQIIVCSIDRSGMLTSQTGAISLVSDNGGGSRTIAVTVTVIPPPILTIAPAELDFGGSETIGEFSVENTGSGTLSWTISESLPDGVMANPMSGSLVANQSQTVTVMFDRTDLEPGLVSAPINITSNGGNGTCTINAMVQSVTVTPLTLAFGALINELSFTISNTSETDWQYVIQQSDLPDWATIDPADLTGTVPAEGQKEITVSVNRTDLGPGVLEDTLSVACEGGANVVTMVIEGPNPELLVAPEILDFSISDVTHTFDISNTGTGTLAWTVEEGTLTANVFTSADIPWLSVDSLGGNTGASDSTTVTVTVDRNQATPNPDAVYQAVLRITSNSQIGYVTVKQRTLPPTLRILPRNVAFGTTYTRKSLAVWNGGIGTVNWEIDVSDKPGWLTVSPVSSGVASGAVTGDETDVVSFTLDRSDLAPRDQDYSWTFNVTATDGNGVSLAPVTATLTMNIARVPTIHIDTGTNPDGVPNVDANGIPFMPFGTTINTRTFTISNQGANANDGTAPLSWSINAQTLPSWITSVTPQQGTINPLGSQLVTVTVDRSSLSFGDESFTMGVISNDPQHPVAPVRVEMQVPKRVIIGVNPSEVAFGPYNVSDSFAVANLGDPGSLLNFELTVDKPWVYVYPDEGTSEGTSDIIKDWQEIGVSIDRTQLEADGGTATITVSAYETNELGERVPVANVESRAVTVSVEATPLSFEAARAITRVPSVVQFVTLMRDIRYLPIPLGIDIIDDYVDGFTIYENNTIAEMTETSKFLTSGANLRTDVVILLDYSGSMFAAAQALGDPNDPDPLQTLYNDCISNLIDELPDYYSVALMEFHERSQPTRLVKGIDGGPAFTSNKAILKQRLQGIQVQDHGATEFLPALMEATDEISYRAGRVLVDPQNQSEVQAIICVSDGRMTTPPGRIKDVHDYMAAQRVRFFPIGWGNGVAHEPLARIAGKTGGHYYPTRPDRGTADLFDWLSTDPEPADQSVAKDLQSQVVLTYITLKEMAPVNVRIDGAFDNPNDGEGTGLPDQGIITGSMTQKAHDFVMNRGDERLGQISLRTDGLAQDGTARVVVRLDYMPRNVTQLELRFTTDEDFTVTQVPKLSGGTMEDWTLVELAPLLPGSREFRLTPPNGEVLPYGAFGDMLYLDFTDVEEESFNLGFDVLYPYFNFDIWPEGKYFTCPDTLYVDADGADAPAGPTPEIIVLDPPSDEDGTLLFGATESVATILIRNRGGSHTPTGVWLNWWIGSLDAGLQAFPASGRVYGSTDFSIVSISLDRSIAEGDHVGSIPFSFTTGTRLYPEDEKPEIPFSLQPILAELPYTATIQDPELLVTSTSFAPGTTTLNFGAGVDPATVRLTNAGESTLDWLVIANALPSWLIVAPTSGALGPSITSQMSVSINREGVAPGNYSHTFTIISDGGDVDILVTMTVP